MHMEYALSCLTILYWTEQNTHIFLYDVIISCGSTHLNKQSCSAEVALDGAFFFIVNAVVVLRYM